MIFAFFDTQQLDPVDALNKSDRATTAASPIDYLHERYLDGHIEVMDVTFSCRAHNSMACKPSRMSGVPDHPVTGTSLILIASVT